MLDFLPQSIKDALSQINLREVYELRLRANLPILINYRGNYSYLGAYGVVSQSKNAMFCTQDEIAECVFRAGKCSIYSVEEQIKQGFITAKDGERLGLAGEYVVEKGQPLTIRNFTSVCIRIPHDVIDSGRAIFQRCMSDKLHNTLLCSPPGIGKTTILRDLCRHLCAKYMKNILVCDERGEIALGWLGDHADVIRHCNKQIAMEAGVRAMRPEIIMTDELSDADCEMLKRVVSAGIIVVGTAHFDCFQAISPCFLRIFSRIVILNHEKVGEISKIYNNEGKELEND